MDQRRKFVPTSSPIHPQKAPRSRPSTESPSPDASDTATPAISADSHSTSLSTKQRFESDREQHQRGRKWYTRLAKRNYLVHLLVKEARLRWFLMGTACLAIAYVGAFARIWRVSPLDAPQELYLRTTDLFQQWSLHRAGLRAAAQGKADVAVHTLMMAASINRFSQEVTRDLVIQVTRFPRYNRDWVYFTVGQLEMLLSPTKNNPDDLRLAAAFYSRYELYDFALPKFRNPANCASPEAALLLLKAHFTVGNWDALPPLWQKYSGFLEAIPEARLYRLAGAALQDPTDASASEVAALRGVAVNPTNGVRHLALHLLIQIDSARLDINSVRRTLALLEDLHDEQLNDYLYLADTLHDTGLSEEARKIVQSVPLRSESVFVAEHQLKLWSKLGLDALGVDFVNKSLIKYQFHYRLILAATPMLVKSGKSDELRTLAVYVRKVSYLLGALGAYDVYLNANAELVAGNRPKAESLFQLFVEHPPAYAPAILQIADELSSNGFSLVAVRLLEKADFDFGNSAPAWGKVLSVAAQARSSKLLLMASRRLHDLRPNDRVIANNFAASLLLTRRHADQAIALTLPLISDFPELLSLRVNHAVALIQLGRAKEAEVVLNVIDPNRLPPEERTGCFFAWTVCQSELEHFDNVKIGNSQIDRSRLFPEQITWLDECLAKLPEQAAK